ncbi:MAG: hypothetical protein ACRC2J_20105, partial [Microcoleaceae cyanobacterium]
MDYWIGKQYLFVPDIINSAINSPADWFLNQPAISHILSNPGVKFLDDFLAMGRENSMLIPELAIATIQSAWSINRATNTRAGDINWLGNDSLNSSSVSSTGQRVYKNSVRFWNSYCLNDLPITGGIGLNPNSYLSEFTERNNNLISQIISELTGLLSQGFDSTAYGKLWRANKAFGLQQTESIINSPGGSLNFPAGEVSAIATPNAKNICDLINNINGWLLSQFFTKFISDFSNTFLPALSAVTTSVVLKILRIGGVNGYRYLAGGMLKDSIKAIIAPTGTNYAVFAWIMAHSPVIILCALVAAIALRRKPITMGRYMYLIGLSPTNQILGMQFSAVSPDPGEKYSDAEDSFRLWLSKEAKYFMNFGNSPSYARILGFNINHKSECCLALDLTNPEQPVEIEKTEMNRFAPYILGDRPWYMDEGDEIHTKLGPSPHLVNKTPAEPEPRPDDLPTWD